VKNAVLIGLQGAGVGVLVASVQNALQHHNRGAMGVLTRSGGTIGLFGAMAATFAFTDSYVTNVRQKEDPLNGAIAGCAVGLLAGARVRSIPVGIASCAGIATLIGTFDAAGSSLRGQALDMATPLTKEERRRRFFKHQPTVSVTPLPGDS